MFENNGIDIYTFEEIPIDRDCYFISEIYMEEFSNALIKMLSGEDINPSEVGYISYVAIRKINKNSIDLSWYPNVHTRFHEVTISLPKEMFKVCVGCWRYDIKPYIFIDHDWLEKLFTREYSVFALIDAIGAKEAIKNNILTKSKLLNLRDRIDELSEKYENILFISFADSLILKSNWSVGYCKNKTEYTYEPELFFKTIKEIQHIYKESLNLSIYAVLAQGSNEYYGEPLHHISKSGNHVCLNSLGVPFAELLAIESAAKAAIKIKLHAPSEIYLDEQYYHSLNFSSDYDKNIRSSNSYKAIMKNGNSRYYFASCDEILNTLRCHADSSE